MSLPVVCEHSGICPHHDSALCTGCARKLTPAQQRGNEIFEALDDYGRGQLAIWGTAFTTYEDEGDEVCAQLNERARAWRAALPEAQWPFMKTDGAKVALPYTEAHALAQRLFQSLPNTIFTELRGTGYGVDLPGDAFGLYLRFEKAIPNEAPRAFEGFTVTCYVRS